MARWNPTHSIIKNFAFGDPVKQYRKGVDAYLSGDCLDFAATNRCAVLINPTVKPADPVVDQPGGEGSDV